MEATICKTLEYWDCLLKRGAWPVMDARTEIRVHMVPDTCFLTPHREAGYYKAEKQLLGFYYSPPTETHWGIFEQHLHCPWCSPSSEIYNLTRSRKKIASTSHILLFFLSISATAERDFAMAQPHHLLTSHYIWKTWERPLSIPRYTQLCRVWGRHVHSSSREQHNFSYFCTHTGLLHWSPLHYHTLLTSWGVGVTERVLIPVLTCPWSSWTHGSVQSEDKYFRPLTTAGTANARDPFK